MSTKTKFEQAREYLQRGLSVVPILKNKETPISWKKYQTERASENDLREWFDLKQFNVAIVTGKLSGLVAVDCDSQEAFDFLKQFNLPKTPTVKTSQGYHLWFSYPQEKEIRNSQNSRGGFPIDLRGEGGLIVAPPSIHQSGAQYCWLQGLSLEDVPLVEFPDCLQDLFSGKKNEPTDTNKYVLDNMDNLGVLYKGVPKNFRNNALVKLLGHWLRYEPNVTFEELKNQAIMWDSCNKPPQYTTEPEVFLNSIKSIWNSHHRDACLPKNIKKDLIFEKIGEMFNAPDEEDEYIVSDWFTKGGISLVAGKPKVGKSTLVRYLALCIAQGKPFLDKTTEKGTVLYLALEEKKSRMLRHFKDMGAVSDDPIHICCSQGAYNLMDELRKHILDKKALLVIIDPLLRFIRIKDSNDYTQVTAALDPLLGLARESNCHILCVHHLGKGERDGTDAVLGSTAIYGTVDVAFLIKRKDQYRTIECEEGRYSNALAPLVLQLDSSTKTFSCFCSSEDYSITQVEERIKEYLNSVEHDESKTEKEIHAEVKGKRQHKIKALRKLADFNGPIEKLGKGGLKDPYKYRIKATNVPLLEKEQGTNTYQNDNESSQCCSSDPNLKGEQERRES